MSGGVFTGVSLSAACIHFYVLSLALVWESKRVCEFSAYTLNTWPTTEYMNGTNVVLCLKIDCRLTICVMTFLKGPTIPPLIKYKFQTFKPRETE